MTNMPKSFQNSQVIETGLSGFRKTFFTILKVFYTQQKPRITQYRSYKNFSNEAFINDQIHFFNYALVGKTVLLKNSVTLNKQASSKKNILD